MRRLTQRRLRRPVASLARQQLLQRAGQILAANVGGTNPTTAAAELELMRPYVGTTPEQLIAIERSTP